MKIKHQLPEVYGRFFPKAFLELDPIESKATCDACVMAPERKKKKPTYQANLKCCTFHPWLPNYAVGAIFRDDSVHHQKSREIIRGKIQRREYVLPTGVVPPVSYQVEFNARAENDFGNRADWLCPFYDKTTNLCTTWRYRGAVCTAYHCKSVHGAAGKKFWQTFENYLSYTEMSLMQEVLANMDFSPRQVEELCGYFNRFDGTVAEKRSVNMHEELFKKLWNDYDDIEKFFIKSLEIVEQMDRKAFEQLVGDQGQDLEERIFASLEMWS